MKSMKFIYLLFIYLELSYDTSFLSRNKVIIDGDVESNPGPVSLEAYRASIGRHNRCKQLKQRHDSTDLAWINDIIEGLCLMTVIGIPLYFMLLTLVCIIAPHFTVLMFLCLYINSLTKKVNQRYSYTSTCYHNTCHDNTQYVMKKKNNTFLRYMCLAILFTSCAMLISNNVPTTIDASETMQNTNMKSNCLFKNLELYDLSFLKLDQLIIDGDVECNPGPVNNNVQTPKTKGRPRKKNSVFRGRKLDFCIEKLIDITNENIIEHTLPDNGIQLSEQINATAPGYVEVPTSSTVDIAGPSNSIDQSNDYSR